MATSEMYFGMANGSEMGWTTVARAHIGDGDGLCFTYFDDEPVTQKNVYQGGEKIKKTIGGDDE